METARQQIALGHQPHLYQVLVQPLVFRASSVCAPRVSAPPQLSVANECQWSNVTNHQDPCGGTRGRCGLGGHDYV